MNYKSLSVWIFVLLMLSIFLMIIYPSNWVIGLGTIGLPVLILVQAFVILTAREESDKTFSDDHWYDRH